MRPVPLLVIRLRSEMGGEEPRQQALPGPHKEEGRRMVAVEAFEMPTPLDTSFNHLGQIYPSFRPDSLCKLHNNFSVSLDDLTAVGDCSADLPACDVQFV